MPNILCEGFFIDIAIAIGLYCQLCFILIFYRLCRHKVKTISNRVNILMKQKFSVPEKYLNAVFFVLYLHFWTEQGDLRTIPLISDALRDLVTFV